MIVHRLRVCVHHFLITINSHCVVAHIVIWKTEQNMKTGRGLDLAMSSHPHMCGLEAMRPHRFVV